jgi:tetratricopeptide (TPR) repeat protein
LDQCLAAFSPDGHWLAYAEWKQPLDLWDLRTGVKVLTLTDGPKYPSAIAFDPTGHFLAVGGGTGEIQIRDNLTGNKTAAWVGHPREVTGLSFTQNATRLASVAGDGCVRLWDTSTGDEVLSLRGHATFDTNLGFSPEGETLLAGGLDGYLRLWSINAPSTDSAEVWRARRRAWHERSATESLSSRQWFSARHHFSQLIQLGSKKSEHFASRGRASAELAQWDQAARDLDAALALPDCSALEYAHRARLYLRTGDVVGYRRVCQRMLEILGNDDSYETQNTVTWICSLSASAIPNDTLLQHAERARAKAPHSQRSNVLNTLGAALFRAGRAEEAVKRLNEAIDSQGQGGTVEDWLFLALAHQSLGQSNKAREWYSRAAEELAKLQAGAKLSDGRTPSVWLRVELDALLQEAKSAVGEKAP